MSAKNKLEEKLQGELEALTKEVNDISHFDVVFKRERIEELDRKIRAISGKARSAADTLTYSDDEGDKEFILRLLWIAAGAEVLVTELGRKDFLSHAELITVEHLTNAVKRVFHF